MDKSFRIHTNINSDVVLDVNMEQDFDFLEVLSLKLRQKDAYRLHSSNYGVIIGRVLANDAFGIPNAKISVFIERDTNDTSEIEAIYPYTEVTTRDREGRRYNLLPDYSTDDCYRIVGTFPNKRLMLDDDIQLEIYDKYWKYSTVTNQSGDYMLFAIPTGSTTLHVDIDLSDIGILSQKPRDFEYKGYNLTLFDSPSQFKESTNLDSLTQIFSQNKSVFVYPFWGDADNGIAALTRADIQINYKFEPTCVFMGSIVSDNEGHSIGHKCAPDVNNGMNDQLIGGNGTIEMIRRTTDGLVEEYQIQGNQLINDNGVWCYQIPMNLDFIGTDEYGNVVPTDNPTKGIPTRAQVRFRISKNETGDEGFSRHTAKYLVPMNPIFSEESVRPRIDVKGSEIEKMYNFGSATPESCFRDLYWNNVYSVKNYIPKSQVAHRPFAKNYTALKGSNLAEDQNPIPFNKLRVDVPFNYTIICILFMIVTFIVELINASVICPLYEIVNTINKVLKVIRKIAKWTTPFGIGGKTIPTLDWLLEKFHCISLAAGLDEGNEAFYPGCWCKGYGPCPSEHEGDCVPNGSFDPGELIDRVQRQLAREYKIIKLDFYQDWVNGCLYMPLWYWRKRRKRSFLFGLIKKRAKNDFCSCENSGYSRLKTYTTCEIPYSDNTLDVANVGKNIYKEKKWHKNRAQWVRYRRGLIRPFVNNDDLTVYYYAALQATSDNKNPKQSLAERQAEFWAVRLYATDIILLGNLLENNLYGIPQFFTCLPSTTANIPPIATIEEDNSSKDEEKEEYEYETSKEGDEESGTTVITGMDWRRDNISEHDTPNYRQGLFMDLGCTFVDTLAKSCINAERLSELGVALDSSYTMRYAQSSESEIQNGDIMADGFVTKLELDDMENRAMFATMNHIGFIPQAYQDQTDAYDTQVLDENTNYFVPKMKYIYPVDFDGRQDIFMKRYRNGFKQPMYDEKDDAYLTFRLGAERNSNYEANNEERIRHFYHTDENNNAYYMPLYNNSFYFYFGIKKGSTAIDKFNEMFYAECFNNDKKPFTLMIDKRPKSYCPQAYTDTTMGYGYIRVNADDIRVPFSYSLRDERNVEIISESDMTERDFVIGGTLDGDEPKANENGKILYQKSGEPITVRPYADDGLINQTYYLTLTDADGRSITERITLEMPKISMEYNTTHLSSKFYTSAITRIDYICHDDNQYYGIIDITGFTCDGYDCTITAATYDDYNSDSGYTVCIHGKSDVSNDVSAMIFLKSMEWDGEARDKETKNCLCDTGNTIASAQGASGTMSINAANIQSEFLGFDRDTNTLSFFVYQPASFMGTITQGCEDCDNLINDNSTSSIITIYNATNFNTYLNTMPTNFIIGTVNDNVGAEIGNHSHFYNTTAQTDLTSNHIDGWYGVHQEDSYMFDLPHNQVSDTNEMLWEDYVLVSDQIHTSGMKRRILQFKFQSMFSLSNAVYVSDEQTSRFEFTGQGGVQPVLIRSIAPYYEDDTKLFESNGHYLFKDNGMVNYLTDYPNIVGFNVSGQDSTNGPQFNRNYETNGHGGLLGNYFAGFTHNGGYIKKNEIDKDKNIMRQPNFASISPYSDNNNPKILGKDEDILQINKVKYVHTKGTQQLNNDKNRNVNPWLRAMNVDRRYDYDFTILGPVMGSTFRLHEDNDEERPWKSEERPWKSLRISGFTYNGIEMSYDEEYNIISATTTIETSGGEVIEQRSNNRLEYSYNYSSGDTEAHLDKYDEEVERGIYVNGKYAEAVTIYNHEPNTVWGRFHDIEYNGRHFGYNSTLDNDNSQLIKESYINDFAGFDLRNFYWSNFNRDRLEAYSNSTRANQQNSQYGIGAFANLINPFYVFHYPANETNLYNGDFNREDTVNGNYPTRRFIDIANIAPSTYYYFENESCSYGMTVDNDSDGSIKATARSKEAISFELEFISPITFTNPNAANEEFGNVIYKISDDEDGYKKFTAKTLDLNFSYNLISNELFDIYTRPPKLVQVLPYVQTPQGETDGITYIKSANPGGEGLYADGNSLDAAINQMRFYTFTRASNNIFDQVFYNSDIMAPQGVTLNNGYFMKNGDRLPSNDNDFANIVFSTKYDLNNRTIDAFTILFDREYKYLEDDNLTRHIRTVEFGDLYDTRYLLAKADSTNSYVEYKRIDTITPVNEPDSGNSTAHSELEYDGENIIGVNTEVEVASQERNAPGEGMLYTQTLCFEMKFDVDKEPNKIQNCAFADTNMMGYIFEFVDNQGGNRYFINCSDVEASGNLILRFNVKWDQNMGILNDEKWTSSGANRVRMAIYAKTPSNFTYKLAGGGAENNDYFYIELNQQQELPTEEGYNNRKLTNFSIV